MLYFVAKTVEERRQAGGGRWVVGNQIIQSEGDFEFQGFNQVRTIFSINKSIDKCLRCEGPVVMEDNFT